MTDYMEPRDSSSAAWSRRLASFSAVLLLTAGIAHRFGVLETAGFIPVLAIVCVLALVALLLAARGFYRLWHFGDRGGRNLTLGSLVALVVLVPFAVLFYRGLANPMLHDISTDIDDPPELRAAASLRTADMNRLGAYSDEQRKEQLASYPLVTGRRYELQFDRIVSAVGKVLEDRGWEVVSAKDVSPDGETTVEAVAHSLILALPADVAIRITDEGASTYVDMRSASRYGRHDFGGNADRIKDFLADLDVEISSLVVVAPTDPAEPDNEEIPMPVPRPQR